MIFEKFDVETIIGCAKITIVPARSIIASSRKSHGFAYFIDGEAIYTFQQKKINIQPKTFLFLPKGFSYKIYRPTVSHCIIVDFTAKDDSLIPDPFAFNCESDELFDAFNDLKKAFLSTPRNMIAKLKSLFYKILSILQFYEKEDYVPSSHYVKIEPAVKFIQNHFTNTDLNIELLSEIAGISPSYLYQEFYRCFKLSPKKYIIQQQLSLARKLLLNSEFSIHEIAISCGFKSEYYFSKLFKDKIGIAPSVYRKNHQ